MKNNLRKNKGITLIALVITIIVLLILAGVSIATLTGENGILTEANDEKDRIEQKDAYDKIQTMVIEEEIEKGEIDNFSDFLAEKKNNGEITEFFSNKDGSYTIEIDGRKVRIDSELNLLEEPLTVEELQEQNKFEYYSSFSKAVTDANNGNKNNADTDKENAVAGIYTDKEGKINVVLMKDTTEKSRLVFSRDMTINLGGHVLTFINQSSSGLLAFDTVANNTDTITIDGRIRGSRIHMESSAGGIKIFQTRSNTFIFNEGTYSLNHNNKSISANITVCGGSCNADGGLEMKNAVLEITTPTLGTINYKVEVFGIQNRSEATITNCDIRANSNLNVKNGQYIESSRGIYNYPEGTLHVNDCNVYGTQAGIETLGKLYLDGGTYEGSGHGGIFFDANDGALKESYVRNATIKNCQIPEGYTMSGTNLGNAGFYVGGFSDSNNITVYMNKCKISGETVAFILGGTKGERNNKLYISNSRISKDNKIRIDNNTHKIYIGKGCSFDISDATRDSSQQIFDYSTAIFSTNEVYTKE